MIGEKMMSEQMTGCPSIDKPWMEYYKNNTGEVSNVKCSAYDYLLEQNKKRLGYIAISFFGRKISFKELFKSIDDVAIALQMHGVKKGDIVSVCMLNSPETVFLFYAINKIGATSNFLGVNSSASDLHEQIVSTSSRLIFVSEMFCDLIFEAAKGSKVEGIVAVPLERSMPSTVAVMYKVKTIIKANRKKFKTTKFQKFLGENKKQKFSQVEISGKETAVIIYTGGSTGLPKGVLLSNEEINAYHANFHISNKRGLLNYACGDSFLCSVPLFLAFGLCTCCHGPLSEGMGIELCPNPDPDVVVKTILKNRINHLIGGRLHFDAIAKYARKTNDDMEYIKSAMYGGEQSDKNWENEIDLLLSKRKVNCKVLNGYGMTETCAAILITPIIESKGLFPYFGVDVMTIHEDGTECGYNEEGELCLSGKQIMTGYYNDELGTREVFFEKNGTRWFKTHDLAKISEDGFVKITGRIKRLYFKVTSDNIQIRVYPMRIEEVLSSMECIQRCAVIGKKDDLLGYRTIAFIILNESDIGDKNNRRMINDYCRKKLPESHIPDEYVFIDEFPLTRAGKVDYRALEANYG